MKVSVKGECGRVECVLEQSEEQVWSIQRTKKSADLGI